MKKGKTLMQMLIEAGIDRKEMDTHESDLYVFVTPKTTEIIDEWCKVNDFNKQLHCPKFTDQITGCLMYDCAFCNDEYWQEIERKSEVIRQSNVTRLKSIVEEIVKRNYMVNEDNGIEIYCDYNDELSDFTIREICKSDNPRQAFWDTLNDFDTFYERNEMFNVIENNLNETERRIWDENEEEMVNFIDENWYFYYPEDHFNKPVKVNIMLDTGDMNYDFTCNNVLNWYGSNGYGDSKGNFDKNSSMLWLAKQQGKATLLRKNCKEAMRRYLKDEQEYAETTECKDKFVVSAMQELANLPSHMATMTFLVTMDLFEFFDLKEAMENEKELNKSYYLEERKGNGYITLDKKVMCGLFNTWNGGGSVLEIECQKDVKIPFKCIFDAVVDGTKIYGYDVDEVYGLIGSAWQPALKEIHTNTTKKER